MGERERAIRFSGDRSIMGEAHAFLGAPQIRLRSAAAVAVLDTAVPLPAAAASSQLLRLALRFLSAIPLSDRERPTEREREGGYCGGETGFALLAPQNNFPKSPAAMNHAAVTRS